MESLSVTVMPKEQIREPPATALARRDGPQSENAPSSLLKNPRQNESSLIQFFYHESVEARMRGAFADQGQLFSYISPEARVRTDHPLRKIRKLVRDVLAS